ncbi:isoprenylcysteine carboxylmethyltransferase family protein [Nitratifractor sp.]|uniref:methyltransferase family protein n=1 Tax=Nitratifractor sp. TaxID=2268144 RepID=UPI0025F60F0F|nr:isoprenylcysteine carboxylmethyltransferase family protein [Nitratifractor sp.]
MKRHLLLLYGLFGYLVGLGTLLYLVFWVYPWSWMPTTIDRGEAHGLFPALAADLLLIALFGFQHSWMVRPRFKRWFDRWVPAGARRATYTLISSLFLGLILLLWQPLPGVLWSLPEGSVGWWIATALYFVGWGVAVIATFQIDHFGLLGLHQAWRAWRGIPEPDARFQERGFYRWVRHPIQAGTLLGLWATPVMSTGHLLFSLGFTLYILIGLHYEERDLLATLGEDYAAYRRRVPMLFPFFK